jgi:Tol biopolymer transport system component
MSRREDEGKKMRRVTRSAVVLAVLAAGLTTVPAGAAAPKPTSPAARQAPYVAVAHKVLIKAPVKAKGTASFRATGVANVPATASAVVVSVSVPKPIASGTLTFFGYGTKRPSTVSLAYAKGRTATGVVVLVPGGKGKVSVYNASTKGDKVIATVIGFYAAPGSTAASNAKTRFVPLTPKRVSSAALGTKPVSFTSGAPSTGVAGIVLSVTVPAPAKPGTLSLYRFGAKPGVADFAFAAHRPTTSLVVVPVGSKGRVTVLLHAKAAVRVWVDVVGYLHQLKVPSAPRSVIATAQNGGALITWAPPAATGGAPVASYRIEVVPGGMTMLVPGQALQTSVGGLKNGTSYTFMVVAVNSVGSGPAAASGPVIPYGVPGSPTNVVAAATGVGTATVTWTPPAQTGGLPLTSYRIVTSPGGATTTAASSPATVTGLASGQVYSFTVQATNGPATSLPSAASGTVVGEGTSRVLPAGTTSANDQDDASISADGRYVAFDSDAQLTPDDTNMYMDVYVRDRLLGTTTLVSVPLPGSLGTPSDSGGPSISGDGRYVVFTSNATNLVNPLATHEDVYLRDLVTRTTRMVSLNTLGAEPDGTSFHIAISGDGSTVAFGSKGQDLTTMGNGGFEQLYVETLATGAIHMASTATLGGAPGNQDTNAGTLSYDGKRVAFASLATNLTSGGLITGGVSQAYVNDAATGLTSMVSTRSDGTRGGNFRSSDPAVSPDGSYVAFVSDATDIGTGGNGNGDVFLHNMTTGATTRVSVGLANTNANNRSLDPAVSYGGRYVAYSSDASNLVSGDLNAHQDVFRTDTSTGVTQLVSASNAGVQGNDASDVRATTADGMHVAFKSSATNLVGSDTNGYDDLFVRDLG